jgi:acyl-CoA thioesterase
MAPDRPLDTKFDNDTAVRRTDDGLYEGHAGAAWWIERGPNGGYLASILLNALTHAVDDPQRAPRSLTVHYLRPAKEGPLRVETKVERAGRSLTTLSARMYQEGEAIAIALGSFSGPWDGIDYRDAAMPEVPSPDEIGELVVPPGTLPRFAGNFDYRWAVGEFPFTGGNRARAGAWMRLKEPRDVDALLLTTLADGCPPSVFARLEGPIPAPTIDLTVHLRETLPRPEIGRGEWVLGMFVSRVGSDGFFEEDGEIWSRDGVLLAHSRQLALLGRSKSG